jgi:hypothetical protein
METPVYDPNKRYTWDKDDKFELSGHQFGTLLNAFRGILNTPEAANILRISQANDIIEEMMTENVEKGTVKEVPDPVKTGQSGESNLKIIKK